MAGKRNINRLRKAMNDNAVESAVKKVVNTAKKTAQSTAASTAAKSGASAARQAAQSSSQYNSESSRRVIKSGEKQRRLQELSKKNEKIEQNNTFLSGMNKYTDKNANASSGKQVTVKELQQATKDIQRQTAKKSGNKKKKNNDVEKFVAGTLKRYAGAQVSGAPDTLEDTIEYLSKTMPNGRSLALGSSVAKGVYDNVAGRIDEGLKTQNIKKKVEKKGKSLQKSGQKDIEEVKKGKSEAAKWGIELGTSAVEMGLDALLTRGKGTMGALYNRAYGSAKQSALDEGASEKQARNYGRAIGGIEAGTEKMFAVAMPLKKLYGAGMGDDVAEALLNKIVKKTSSKAGKNLAYHGGKVSFSAITEGLEEMVSEGLDPVVANKIYADALGTPHSTSAKEILYAGSIGGALGGILGGAGQVVEYGQGRRVQNVFGEDGVKALAKAAKEVDDAGTAVKGSAINEMINRGEGIAAGQANELYKAVYEQEMKDLERNDIVNRSAERIMKRENLISPVTVDSQTGEMMVGKKTMESYTTQKAEAEKAINELAKEETDLSLPELTKDQIASAVAAVQTGVAGVDEINLFTTGNPQARAVYESVTGKILPETNAGTREMLYRENGMNRIESARAETKGRIDEVKGLIGQDMGKYYESAGQEAFSQAFGDVNVGDAVQVDDMINTFDDFYRAGRNDISYETVISYQNPVHANVSSEVKKAAWEAGQQDKILASETAKGLQMKIGETAKKNRSQGKMSAYKGRLYSELSNENKARFTASQQIMLRALARVFNIDIHVVDSVENGANGYYKDGKMYISMEADRALEYVFAHEITHHMQQYAPEEYSELKELVRKSWAQQGGIDEAVDFKVAQYAQHGVELSREDALDEILADSTYEVLQDETFVEELCKENRSIAQSILNAIKDVLKKLRSLLTDGDRFTPAQNAQLLSNLDILKEFEKKWTEGLLRSVENRDAVMHSSVDTIKYSKKNDNSTIREQLRENLAKLADMKPVADVQYESIKHLNRSEKAKAIMSEYNKKFKGGVERRGFGFIVLREDEVIGSLKYLHTDGEFAAFKVLPQVLKRGEIIDEHIDHKKRNIDTVTIAAPVIINDTLGYMAAIVKVGGKNRYHVHRILMPDGSEFEFNKKTEPIGAGMSAQKSVQGSAISSVSENSVTPADGKSNGKSYSFKGIDDGNVKYSIREDDPPKKTVKGYKVFVVKNGKLYPPMVANPGGADTPVGVWLDADEGVRAGESKTGRPQVKAGGKGTQGGSGKLAYRPGWHLGEAPMATQFARLNKETGEKELFPENFVWAECEVAADHDYQDEAMSYGYSENGKFRHAYAGLPRIPKDGMYRYRTNPDPSTVPWIISGSMKVTKVLSDAEVDEILRSNATVSETAPEDKSKLWVDSSDGDTLKYWYGSKKEWRKAPVVRKGGKKTLEELGIANDAGSGAVKFSLKEPVEENKNLIAVHNIKESELMKTFDLGGFPMPSIAIIKGRTNFAEYGPISVLFSKDTIDPESNADNEVYSGDAWTPVYPTIEFKADEKAAKRIYDRVLKITKDNVPENVRRLLNHFNPANIEDELNRYRGEAGLFETYQNDTDMKNVYLADKGEAVYDVYEKTEKRFAPKELEEIKKYIAELGGEEAARGASKEEWTEAVRKVRGIAEGEKIPGPVVFRVKNRTLKYLDIGESWTEEKYDYDATVKAIEEKTNQSEYEAWLKAFFAGLEEKSGIRNNTDMFDDMGNRRSFDELHYEESLENVVKAMRQEENGGAVFAGQNIWSAATRKYEDIEDIKNDSERLMAADQESYDKLRSEYTERLQAIVSDIMDYDTDNEFIARDNAAECIIEAVRYSADPDEIYDYLQDYPQLTVTEKNAEEIGELIEDIAAMPTEYFEAKPRRAIGFDEVKAVILPSNADAELKTAIENAGIEMHEYKADDDADRVAKVNEVAEYKDVKFSLKNKNLSPDARIPYTVHQSYISVKKNDNAALKNLQDSVRKLKRGTYENKATGYKADIIGETIGKIINPRGNKISNPWSKKYIDNLNAATQLPELFKNAVYIDTKGNQKAKKAKQQIQGYHHFVAPIYMDGKEYRVRIVAREKQNSDTLYIVETEIMPIKNGSSVGRSKASQFVSVPFDISIPELVNGVKIYDYNMQKNDIYNHNDIKYSMPDETSVIDYMAEHETEFVDLTGFRDYEVKAKQVRQQTYGELAAQVEKLKNDKRFTKGKVLDESSVREEINDMIVTLMSYSESYNSLGVRKKTDHNLVREGVNAAKQIFTAMKKGDVSDVVTKAELAAQQIVENLKLVEDTAYTEYKDLRDYLRATRMVISEEDAADIPDFKQFKKSNFGRIRIVSQNGIPVDTAYQELTERYPELFSDEITHPADMLRAIADVRESLEPYDIMLSAEENEQLIKQTAQDLIDIAATGKAWKSWADKKKEQYDEKLKMLKQRQQEALRDVKKKERDRAEEKLRKERQKGKERLDKAKEKSAEKLQAEKDKAKEKAERQKDSRERKRLIAGIEQNRKWLSDRLSKPTDDKHIPEGFRTALADLLSKIDMQSQKSKALEEKTGQRARRWVEMDELKARFAEIEKEDGSGSFEYDGYVFEIMESLAKKLGGKSVDEASTQQLQEFDVLMKYIANGIKNYNKAFDESIKEEISQLALESMDNAKARQAKLKDGKFTERSGILGGMNKILNESMVTPRDFFERIGGGLEKTFMGLRHGMDRHVDNMTKTREFFEGIFRQYNNKKKPGSKIEEWRNGKQVTAFDVQGGKIRLTPAQVMSLYCLAKREQAMGHILGSGIVASRVDSASKIGQMLGAKIQTGGSAVTIGMEDIVKITESLTQEQKAMADKLQSFLNDECSGWGNEVSMRLYGYRKFTEENYFPIKSADAYLDSNFEGREVSERIKNFGFTKGTVVNANNPIMIDDIFSVVSDHINKMSLYNAFAAPISDFTRVYNYKSRDDAGNIDGSVKSAVEQAYGKKAINYISNFMADLNNQTKMHTDGILGLVNKSLANYKKSAIGGNLRVALQQPTAVARSFVCINPKYFANGKVNLKKNLRDMKEHCQIARWKSWGFSQVDMARDIDQIMMNNEWSRLDLATMQIYGFLDDVTWSTIWAAVRTETEAKHKNVKVDSEEFYRICNERASEIFDKTQVVDSVFHRSQAMRNKQVMSKMVTSFMAEPTRTFNMMRTEFLLAKDMWQEGDKAKAVGKMMRATSVFTFNAALCSAAAAAADALRGRTPNDDDDDSWLANFLANFWDNLNPLNMIPVVKDIWGFANDWDASNMSMEGWEKLVQGTMDFIQSPSTDGFLNMCDGLGYVTGLPIRNVRREAKIILKKMGLESFAAEEGGEETADKKSIMDKIFGSFNIKDGSRMDNFLNHFNINLTDEERSEKEYKDQLGEIEKDIKDLSGSEKEEKIWEKATKNYTNYISDGDMESVARCRRLLEDLGGDVDKFDKSVESKVKTALKKNIGENADPYKAELYRDYLTQQGMNASQISSEIIAKSDTAKEFQIALCLDDEDAAVDSLSYLIDAGISYEDAYVLFVNRTKAIKASDFSTGELAYPVTGEITSAFGGRESPGGIGSTDHKGIDIGVAMNSDVAAADGGKVTYADWNGRYGYMVRVDHGNGRETEYAHLNGYYVQKGQSVKKGEVIALSGSTGNSTGPHLHFGVKQDDTYVDPMIYFR